MKRKMASFRVGKVRASRRGKVWYLCYYEAGQRRRPRVGPDQDQARQMAAQINGQLEVGAPAALSFEPISIPDLRERWLEHHEQVLRSSLQTIRRYRAATQHLLRFVREVRPVRLASDLRASHAQELIGHLRSTKVAPNGHPKARKRLLRDSGVKFILETCCSLFNYAQRHRHLPPYAENPFYTVEVRRMPVEDCRPIVVFTEEEQRRFLEVCDDWQFPMFLTLLLTGMRPGELTHLLLPNDLDLETGWLYLRNKPQFGWQVKTRNERDIPLVPVLVDVLRLVLGGRTTGPAFRQRRCNLGFQPMLAGLGSAVLQGELAVRVHALEVRSDRCLTRAERLRAARTIWRDTGGFRTDVIRNEFMDLTSRMGLSHVTAPKTLRHTFATMLQDANVDPLIRNELMGHVPAVSSGPGPGLGMTAVYTHTRPETKRRQLETALANGAAAQYARTWLERQRQSHR